MQTLNTRIKEIYSDRFTSLTWFCIGFGIINLIESVSRVAALALSIIYLMYLPVFIRSLTECWRKKEFSAKEFIRNVSKRDKIEWLITMLLLCPFLLLRFFWEIPSIDLIDLIVIPLAVYFSYMRMYRAEDSFLSYIKKTISAVIKNFYDWTSHQLKFVFSFMLVYLGVILLFILVLRMNYNMPPGYIFTIGGKVIFLIVTAAKGPKYILKQIGYYEEIFLKDKE
ncbi:MAG: hypothetical protein IJD86_13410 [Clostridia bacterium]|nr:hypothetical protein [Clostridia bacterium]